ncbi:MAG: FAD-dependent oxidoreductase [Proteobacteria bacterium]|nr:FAD-dependent oxidoreductase [Pseudomonadota bacterium]MDA1057737.1 FAD-dependent oxidoreductase [Pseudomonadota bacterium]
MTSAKDRYPNLFSPFDLGPTRLRNRTVIPGHSMSLSHFEPGISDRYRAYLVARAEGGAGLVGIESAPMHESTKNASSSATVITDAATPSLAKTAEEVHAAGAAISIILWHGGHNIPHRGGAPFAVAPSPIPSFRVRETPKVLTKKEIHEIVRGYGAAARRCREAGVDVIEVQTATDYLLGHFMSHRINWRDDEYGGSLENRMRIVADALEAVREAAGDKITVGVRTSVAHEIPSDPQDFGIEDSVACMQYLAERGLVDYVSLLTGSHWAMGATIPPMTRPRPQIADEAAVFKKHISVPITVAGRIRTASEAEAILAGGQADLIAMARTWIAEPDWMRKLVEDREDEIRPCMSCSQGCLGFVTRGQPGTCIINPVAGRETEIAALEPAAKPKHIAVVGGGPAGMEAARVAALRGHRVELYESLPQLGGQMRLAAEAPHRGEMLPAIEWWENELQRLQVRVHLGAAVTADKPPAADEVVWAVGSEPGPTQIWRIRPHLRTGIPGTDGLAHGREIMAGTAAVSGKVLVIDEEGGWPAVSLCETLAATPDVTSVDVITSEVALGAPELDYNFESLDVAARIRGAGITVHASTLVDGLTDGVATLRGGGTLGPFDAVVMATGTTARAVPEDAHAIGDCVAPRSIWAATRDAAVLARGL